MKHLLALAVLFVLVLGFAAQAQAQQRIQCDVCEGYNTWARYEHVGCPNGAPPFWPKWDQEAMSDDGELPPDNGTCPLCAGSVPPWSAFCADCSTDIWP